MKENRRKIIRQLAGAAEILALSLMYYVCFDLYREAMSRGLFLFRGKYFLIGLYFIIAYIVFHACESFRFDKNTRFDLAVSQCISCIFVNAITWLQICLIQNGMITPLPMLYLTLAQFVFCILCSMILVGVFGKNVKNTDALLISAPLTQKALEQKISSRSTGQKITTVLTPDTPEKELYETIDRYESVIVNDVPAEKRNDIVKYCFEKGKSLFVVPKITDIILKGAEDIGTLDTPVLRVDSEGPDAIEAFFKRAGDLLMAFIAMIPGIFIILFVAAAIKIEDGGPVFYTQERVTKGGRSFRILKFRSMIVNAEKNTGAVLATDDDPRITKVGRFLRSCRLDEFPQFINILKGEMSIVGPRPERTELTKEICREMPEFAFRTRVKAGLTGYAQVYGKYSTTNYDKLRLDLIYIEKFSLLLDLKLILMTPQVMFRKEASEGVSTKKDND